LYRCCVRLSLKRRIKALLSGDMAYPRLFLTTAEGPTQPIKESKSLAMNSLSATAYACRHTITAEMRRMIASDGSVHWLAMPQNWPLLAWLTVWGGRPIRAVFRSNRC
jgi:hypothetical protein